MDIQQMQVMVDMLGQLGEMSLVAFCVWIGAEFLQPIIVASMVLGGIAFAIKVFSVSYNREEFFKYVRDKKKLGLPGDLSSREKDRVMIYLRKLVEESRE